MIDIHCHILPGIDDGAADWDQSLEMARIASKDGIKKIIATPHFEKGRYEPSVDDIIDLTEELNKRINDEGMDLLILPGMEIHVEPTLIQMLRDGEVLTLNNQGKYLLVEFPPESIPPHSHEVLYEIRVLGITPIMAHAERNLEIQRNPQKLFGMVESGLLTQVTSASIEGNFGHKCRNTANLLLKHNLAHFIASDAHYMPGRMPKIKRAHDSVKEGMPEIYALLKDYERTFEKGEIIMPIKPLPLTSKGKRVWKRSKR